jgi:hypothetical protein
VSLRTHSINQVPLYQKLSEMKHQNIIDRIRNGTYTRAELITLRTNAESMQKKGDADAKTVIDEIDKGSPADKTMVFMGFCPGANFENRLDIEWKANGICTFIFFESEQQVERFNNIWPGDLIILKKRHQFGKTMLLYGYGRVTGVKFDNDNNRYLEMNWSPQEEIIEVPLMGANSTVDVRTIEQVEGEMPGSFYTWLNYGLNQ